MLFGYPAVIVVVGMVLQQTSDAYHYHYRRPFRPSSIHPYSPATQGTAYLC